MNSIDHGDINDNTTNDLSRTQAYQDLRIAGGERGREEEEGEMKGWRTRIRQRLDHQYGFPDQFLFFSLSDIHTMHKKIQENWKVALTLILIALPSGITIAVSSGLPPIAGLASLSYGGLIGSPIGSSVYNIFGPTSATAFVTRDLIETFHARYPSPRSSSSSSSSAVSSSSSGSSQSSDSSPGSGSSLGSDSGAVNISYSSMELVSQLTFTSGFIIFLFFYVFRLHKLIVFIPTSVAEGFKQSVGITLTLSQFKPGFGLLDLPREDDWYKGILLIFQNLESVHLPSIFIFFGTIALLMILPVKWPTPPWLPYILTLSISISAIVGGENYVPTLRTQFGDIPRQTAEPFNPFNSRHLPLFFHRELWIGAFSLATTATLETILSAKTGERLATGGKSPLSGEVDSLNQPREVLSLGIANILVGALGGLSASGGVARTVIAVKSGSTSRMAGFLTAIGINLASLLILPFFEYVPLSTLAASSFYVGWQMLSLSEMRHLYLFDKKGFALACLTILAYILEGPAAALIFPSLLALLIFARHLRQGHGDIWLGKTKAKTTGPSSEQTNMKKKRKRRRSLSGKQFDDLEKDGFTFSMRNFDKMSSRGRSSGSGTGSGGNQSLLLGMSSRDRTILGKQSGTEEDLQNTESGERGREDNSQLSLYSTPPTSATLASFVPVPWYPNILVYSISGQVCYINRFSHVERIKKIDLPYRAIIFSLKHCFYLDVDGVDAFGDMLKELKKQGKIVALSSLREPIRLLLQKSIWYLELYSQGLVFPSEQAAINSCGERILAITGGEKEDEEDRKDNDDEGEDTGYEDIMTGQDDYRIDVEPSEHTTLSPVVTR